MIEGWIFWTVIMGLVAVGLGAFRAHRVHVTALQQQTADSRTDYERQLQTLADDHEQHRAALIADHRQRMASAATDHRKRLVNTTEEHAEQIAQAEARENAALAEADRFHELATKNVDWDLRSRKLILEACRNLKLNGALATNLMFVPQEKDADRPYVVQIDHVLLTDSFALVIENKGWAGVVFDGVRPSAKHPSFSGLINEEKLDGAYSVQIKRDDDTSLTVHAHTQGKSPRSQVRLHSKQLFAHLRKTEPSVPWFRTCVLYSNARLTLYSSPNAPTSGGRRCDGSRDLSRGCT